MNRFCIYLISALVLAFFITSNLPAAQRGVFVKTKDASGAGKRVRLYSGYYALVIGVSDYDHWPDLQHAVDDAREVAQNLKQMGFSVKLVENPTYHELKESINTLTYQQGRETEKAVLLFYAGHGETETLADDTQLGYLVPKDCPLIRDDPVGFVNRAVSMKEIEAYSLRIRSKHVLMLFDACFSGSIFSLTRAAPENISEKTTRPVRQFITAGGPNETVPDKSIFKHLLLLGLKGDADLIKDGYITGSELGLYLSESVIKYTRGGQHPQYGKINNPNLDRGDFVFVASSAATIEKPSPKQQPSFSVNVSETGADVYIDGKKVGQTPFSSITLSPGKYRMRVEKDGFEPYHRTINIEPGRDMALEVYMNRERVRKARFYAKIDPSDAKIRILNISPQFYQGIDLDTGRYHVEVSADGYETKTIWVKLSSGEDKTIDVRLKPKIAKVAPGRIWRDQVTGIEFVWVPGGCFQMGSPSSESGRYSDEDWVYEACVDGFWMGKFEVTNTQFRRFKSNHESKEYNGNSLNGENQPAVYVSWKDAKAFAEWLTRQNNGRHSFRLPTEAEWEYAARAGTTTARYWGDDSNVACQYANVSDRTAKQSWPGWTIHNCDDGYAVASPVGQFKQNSFGLYDILGNVWEWCEDIYSNDAYRKHQRNNPIYKGKGALRVFRGGGWGSGPNRVRSASRGRKHPDYRYNMLGFRLVRDF